VLGVIPGLLAVWVLRSIPEPPRARAVPGEASATFWTRPTLARIGLASSVTSTVLFAYWGLFTWIPAYLSTPLARGGAGMTVVQSSGFIVPMQIGSFFGYTLFGFLADRFGRRPTFLTFVLAAAVVAPIPWP
jgi:predicted MFS family arabinose efflux permease